MAPQRKNSNDPSLNEEEEEDVDESYYHDGKEDIKNLVHECEELSDMVVASVAKRLAVPESDAESAEPPKKKVKVEDNHAVKLKLVPVDQAVQLHSFVDASIKLQASSVSEPPMVHQIDVDMTSFISYHENTRKSDLEGYIEIPPNSDMTGVDETTTRICAALSGQIYTAKSKYDFDLSISGRVVEVILFDDNGILAETTPPIAIAITGNTMIIGWRGSQTLMDWIMDFAFAPMASRSWVHMAPSIRAQGGYCALVESYMCKHESTILKEVKTRGIQEILLTGHSLAGGLAQVAHCFLEGERLAVSSPWKCLDQVNIRCISFSAPMTTVNLNRKDKGSAKFLKKVGSNASNIIFESDPVPRAYAHLSFLNKLVKNAIPQVVGGIKVPGFLKWAFGLQKKINEAIKSNISKQEELIGVAARYRHIGKVIYYKDHAAEPEVYIDKGFFYKKSKGSTQKLFHDIEYVQSDDVKKSATDNHLFLVTGPGLAYNVKRSEL